MSITYLKIKIKSLADESRTIRKEELRLRTLMRNEPAQRTAQNSGTREGLHLHRVKIVREASRASLLAYGYLRGRKYSVIEGNRTGNWPPLAEIRRLVVKYGGSEVAPDAIKQWWLAKDQSTAKQSECVTPPHSP